MYESTQFRFPMGERGRQAVHDVLRAVADYCRYAPNQGSDETPRENIRSAFLVIRSRLNRGHSIQAATAALERIADSMRDM